MKRRCHNETALLVNVNGGKMDYEGGEVEDTLDWVKDQQKQNSSKTIDDRMEQETESLKRG